MDCSWSPLVRSRKRGRLKNWPFFLVSARANRAAILGMERCESPSKFASNNRLASYKLISLEYFLLDHLPRFIIKRQDHIHIHAVGTLHILAGRVLHIYSRYFE